MYNLHKKTQILLNLNVFWCWITYSLINLSIMIDRFHLWLCFSRFSEQYYHSWTEEVHILLFWKGCIICPYKNVLHPSCETPGAALVQWATISHNGPKSPKNWLTMREIEFVTSVTFCDFTRSMFSWQTHLLDDRECNTYT